MKEVSTTFNINSKQILSLQSNLIKMSFFDDKKMSFQPPKLHLLAAFTVHDIWRIFQILNSRRFHALANWIIIIFIYVWHFSIHRAKYNCSLSRHVCAVLRVEWCKLKWLLDRLEEIVKGVSIKMEINWFSSSQFLVCAKEKIIFWWLTKTKKKSSFTKKQWEKIDNFHNIFWL